MELVTGSRILYARAAFWNHDDRISGLKLAIFILLSEIIFIISDLSSVNERTIKDFYIRRNEAFLTLSTFSFLQSN